MGDRISLLKGHSKKSQSAKVFKILIPVCVLFGIALGLFYAGWWGRKGFNYPVTDILPLNANNIGNLDTFLESLLKYGKYSVLIWLMAFIPYGHLISLLVIIIRGFGYGFTTGLLINSFGSESVKYVILLYLPQMIISFFGYYYVAKGAFCFSSKNNYKAPITEGKARINRISRYFLTLLIALMFEIFCALIETKITPILLFFV